MGALRSDQDAWDTRIDVLEHENATLKYELEKKDEEIQNLQHGDRTLASVALAIGDATEEHLREENRYLREQVALLERCRPVDVVDAARDLARLPEISREILRMKKGVRRSRWLVFIAFSIFIFLKEVAEGLSR